MLLMAVIQNDDDDVKKIRFTSHDKYNRREALKKFLDIIYLRCKIESDKDMEMIESNPVLKNYMMANQSSYDLMMNDAIKSFVTRY